jgi:branched-chain amino acid aminotransferase
MSETSDLNVFLNGRIVPQGQAAVSVSDAGLLHGVSAYTTALAHNGVVFRLDRHLSRLFDTVQMLGMRTDATPDILAGATSKLLAANSLTEARVRITLTPGSVHGGEPTTLVTASPLPAYPPEWYEQGIGVVISSLRQGSGPPVYGCKTGCFLPRILARQEAAAKGAQEALWFTEDNRLAEGCTCNVFIVLAGEVLTPPTRTPVLPGIVREAVLELCRGMEVPCSDNRSLTIRELLDAQEVFLTSACAAVRPVVRIERHAVGGEKPGPVTRWVMRAYRELLDRECGLPGEGAQS